MDRLRMEQAMDNVVGNSCKYAGTDIHVSFDSYSVETSMSQTAGGMKAEFLRIHIKDEGPGFYFYLVKYYMEKQDGGLEYYNDNGFTVELLLRKA